MLAACGSGQSVEKDYQKLLPGAWEFAGTTPEGGRVSVVTLEFRPSRKNPENNQVESSFTRIRGSRAPGEQEIAREHVFDTVHGRWFASGDTLTLFLDETYGQIPQLHAGRETWRILELTQATLRIAPEPASPQQVLRFTRKP
jgi:hypothetical protein